MVTYNSSLFFYSCNIVLGCVRSSKEKLVELDIIQKVSADQSESSDKVSVVQQRHVPRYSRPGSSYVLATKATTDENGKMNNKVHNGVLYICCYTGSTKDYNIFCPARCQLQNFTEMC